MKPFVSVLIDTYNQERYIEQAIVSVLEQDFPASDMEILVVDDGSTDRTPEIVHKFAPRVRCLRKKNGGQASAFNAAFPETHAPIVAFLDGDDWFVPGKLTTVIETLEQKPEAAGVGHGYYEFDEQAGILRVCAAPETKFLHLTTPGAAREAQQGWGSMLTSSFTVRREILKRVIPIPESLAFCADAPIALAAIAAGTCLLKQPFCFYRRHPDNLDAVDPRNVMKLRRKCEMNERMFQLLEQQLIRLGTSQDSVAALLCGPWTDVIRLNLRTFGGSRMRAFRTEMRYFRSEFRNPSIGYLLFKYAIVGMAALLLSPARFYEVRDWYWRRKFGNIRERLCGTN